MFSDNVIITKYLQCQHVINRHWRMSFDSNLLSRWFIEISNVFTLQSATIFAIFKCNRQFHVVFKLYIQYPQYQNTRKYINTLKTRLEQKQKKNAKCKIQNWNCIQWGSESTNFTKSTKHWMTDHWLSDFEIEKSLKVIDHRLTEYLFEAEETRFVLRHFRL